jgi:hypothetical protein
MSQIRPDGTAAVVHAANTARGYWNHVAGSGDGSSWLDQMAAGKLPPDWPPGHAAAVAELLDALGERARDTRAVAGVVESATARPCAGSGFVAATHSRLPMNRKERYFTGTVLPMLIGDNGFAHLYRFLELCGLRGVSLHDGGHPLDGEQDVQFFTEYGFEESVYTKDDRARLAGRPRERDTPDVVLCGADWLVAVEAKMYHRPSREALEQQFAKQHVLVEFWTTRFRLDRARVAHVLLLPGELEKDRRLLSPPVITWEQVAAAYATVGTAYWFGVLQSALDRYSELCSPEPTFRTNADTLMSGADIVAEHGQGTLPYTWMGRSGGKNGKTLAGDIATGAWRDQQYEVRCDPMANNPNWFAVSHFVSITASS